MLKVLKLILEIIKNIKIKMGCCYESQCSINANEIDTNEIDANEIDTNEIDTNDEENNVNRLYNETFKDSEVDE